MKTSFDIGANIMESAVERSSQSLSVTGLSPLESFGEIIKILRQKKSLTINEFAIQAGLTARTIAAVETGKAPLEEVLQALPALAGAVGVQRHILSGALFDLGMAELEERAAPSGAQPYRTRGIR